MTAVPPVNALIREAQRLIEERRTSRGYLEQDYASLSRHMGSVMEQLLSALESVPATTSPQATTPTREQIVAAFISEAENDHDYDPEWDYRLDAKRYADAVLSLLSSGQTPTNDEEK